MNNPTSTDVKTNALDVLIIGGGVQGLWLLNDLSKVGYNTILVEKDKVGGLQTLHSHGYLHQGYLYSDEQMARRLKGAEERWKTFCKNNCLEAANLESYFGFASHANATLWKERWENASLNPDEQESLPSFMENGLLRRVFRTNETWLDTKKMTQQLANNVRNRIYTGQVTKFDYDLNKGTIESVSIDIDSREHALHPGFVICAAGEGNRELLLSLPSTRVEREACEIIRARQSQMLVIKGKERLLRQLALIVPDLALFIVSRKHWDGEVVWLVSYDVDEEYEAKLQRHSPDVDVPRIQSTIVTLSAILPTVFSEENKKQMKWGCYTGVKAEVERNGKVLPNEWIVETFGVTNLYVVWPTKMTLAPEASEKIVFKLLDAIPCRPFGKFEPKDHGLPESIWASGEETWTTLDLCGWDKFKETHYI